MGAALEQSRTRDLAPGRPPIPIVLGLFAGMVVILSTVATIAAARVTRALPLDFLNGPAWLDAWFQMDSGWYYSIAADGYWYAPGAQSPIAFFPSYPMTVRAVGLLTGGDYQIAGTMVAVLCGAGSVTLFTIWVWRRLPRAGAVTAIALLMLYPYAFYMYGAMYSDSLFFLVTVGAFLLLDHRRYWLAGLLGAVATAGRPVGVAVAIGLVIRMLEMQAEAMAARRSAATSDGDNAAAETVPVPAPVLVDGHPRPRFRELFAAIPTIRWRQAGVFASGLGLAGWCLYLWWTFGDPLIFIEVQSAPGWSQGVGPPTWFKFLYFQTFIEGRIPFALVLSAQAAFCLLAVLLLRRVSRQFGWGYVAYTAVVIAIPIIGTRDFMGTGRYVMAAFPAIAAAGCYLATTRWRWLRPVTLGVLAFGLLGATVLYAMGLTVS